MFIESVDILQETCMVFFTRSLIITNKTETVH